VLPYGLHIPYEMWIVILKRKDHLEDIAINGKIDMHLEEMVLEFVDFTFWL
jgi:hypothetical protein